MYVPLFSSHAVRSTIAMPDKNDVSRENERAAIGHLMQCAHRAVMKTLYNTPMPLLPWNELFGEAIPIRPLDPLHSRGGLEALLLRHGCLPCNNVVVTSILLKGLLGV
jgi:hypothetical protein